ncbi:MAG: hypothetical protein FJ271_11180, partial [Planctomycetes bacterium]|nr:hypothetical protein [Planctomycetota bacterium]
TAAATAAKTAPCYPVADLLWTWPPPLRRLDHVSQERGWPDGHNFSARAREVWAAPNHNWLRITRILRCLSLAGMATQARALCDGLLEFHTNRRFAIPASTLKYWTDAVRH